MLLKQQYHNYTLINNFIISQKTNKLLYNFKITFLNLYWKQDIKKINKPVTTALINYRHFINKSKYIYFYKLNTYNFINILVKSFSILKYSLILIKFSNSFFNIFSKLYIYNLFKLVNFIFFHKYIYFKHKIKLLKY
jgi:hypothetical protein